MTDRSDASMSTLLPTQPCPRTSAPTCTPTTDPRTSTRTPSTTPVRTSTATQPPCPTPALALLPRRRTVAAIAVAVLAVVLVGCQPPLTLGRLDQRVHVDPLDAFQRWWIGEQAALHRVGRSTVERWVREGSPSLDDRASRSGPWDLSTDGCSFAPDAGPTFDFRWPCIRHDLAWRNLKRLDRSAGGGIDTRARRLRANDRFLDDMATTCRTRPLAQRVPCLTIAATYAQAVDLAA